MHDPPVTDLYLDVQRACEKHLAACFAALYAEDNMMDEPEPHDEVDILAPFCGCETCTVREVLHAARPYFARLAEAERAAV
jgi:hypothetical protein